MLPYIIYFQVRYNIYICMYVLRAFGRFKGNFLQPCTPLHNPYKRVILYYNVCTHTTIITETMRAGAHEDP